MHLRTLGGLRLEASDLTRPKPLLLLVYLAVEGPQHRRHLSELFWPGAAAPLASLRTALAQLKRGAPGAVEVRGGRLAAAVPSDVRAVLDVGPAAAVAWSAYRLPGAAPPTPETLERAFRLLVAGGGDHAATLRRDAAEYGLELRSAPSGAADRTDRPAPPTNLRPRATSFVGRDLELVEVARLLADPETRLVTLTGPGGVGKSSLAWAAARQELRTGTYPGGVFLASLESAPDGAVASTLAAAMGLNGVETVDELAAAIGAGRTLLVLDGCERLVGALGAVSELLAACEGLKVLATSRERLGLPGEQLFPVDGLPLPAEGEDPMRTRYLDSVRLFEQRAKRVDLGFTLDAGSLPHVAAVCRTVAGSPLGIELAAALVRLLPPAELAAELARDLDLLASADAALPDRHRSLRAAFDHSWGLLGPRERAALGALATFAGGFTREAAARVAGASLPVLAALVDKSLVSVMPGGRYETHPLVRQYAREELAKDPERDALVRRRLVTYLREVADEARAAGGAEGGRRDRLDAEHENVRGALAQALGSGDVAAALTLAAAVWSAWHDRGRWHEARSWLERAVEAWDASEGRAASAGLAGAAYGTGDEAETSTGGVRSAAGEDLSEALAEALYGLGVLAAAQGDLEAARRSTERSLAVCERRGDRERVGALLNHLGVIALNAGDFEAAAAWLREALAVRLEVGDERGRAATLNNLGAVAGRQGDVAAAKRYYEESLATFRRLDAGTAVAITLGNLGDVAEYEGDLPTAKARYDESLTLHRQLGNEPYVAFSLVRLAALARRCGDADSAWSLGAEALQTLRDLGDLAGAAECLNELALVMAGTGRHEPAAVAWGAMSVLLERAGAPLQPSLRAEHDAAVAAVREAAGPAAFEAAWERGRRLTLDAAVAFALEASGTAHEGTRRD